MFTITIAEDGTIYVEEAPPEVLEALRALAPGDPALAERIQWSQTSGANSKS